MKGIKIVRLGLVGAAVAVALLAGLLVGTVSAQEVSIGDATAAPGEQVDVTLEVANIGGEELGAWRILITYDPDVVSVADCAESSGSVCNPAFDDTTVLVNGASASGVDDATLATITFECGASEGSSDLTLVADTLADATIGDPQDISGDVTLSSGSITCAEAEPEPTAEPTEEPTLPETGISTGSDGGSAFGWLIAALAGAGLAAIVGFGAFRLSARRSQ